MYQASDGKWYPVSSMPQGQQGGYGGGGGGYGGGGYGHGGGMQYGQQQQPIYVQQGHSGGGGGAAAGTGCLGEYELAGALWGLREATSAGLRAFARPR